MKPNLLKLYLALAALEGGVALIFTIRAALPGLSTSWLAISLLLLVLTLSLAGLTAWTMLNRTGLERLTVRLDRQVEHGDRLSIFTIVSTWFLISALFILWRSPLFQDYHWYANIFKNSLHSYEVLLLAVQRASALLVWLAAILFQTLVLFLVSYPGRYRQREFWGLQVISRTILLLAVASFSLLQWFFLAMLIPMHDLLPGWYWSIQARPFTPRLLLFLALLGISLFVVIYLIRRRPRVWLSLLILVGLGYVLQVGMGVVQGGGYEYVRMKYAGSNHRSYAAIATSELPNPLDAARQYEEKYGFKMFPSTKPPGVVLYYVVVEKFVNWVRPEASPEARFLTLTRWLAYIFPLLSFLVVGVIYLFMRQLVNEEDALFPAIMYIFIPNVILLPMFLDNALYPLLFMTGVYLIWRVVQTRSLLLAALAGIYFYAAIYFTFSLLTLLPFFFVLLGLDYLMNRKERRIPRQVALVLAMGVGIAALFFLMREGLNYDIVRRYTTAMRVVRNFDFVLRTGEKITVDLSKVTVQPSFRQIMRASFLNILEFAAAVGFPVFFLFVWRVGRTLWALVRRQASHLDMALGAICLTFIAMNLYGQMQGEASRIWIFWVPMVVMFAGVELISQFKRRDLALYIVMILQLITILMIFQFQDFIV